MNRRRAWRTDARPSHLSFRDLVSEAIAGLTQRPGRSVLTMLGTVLGVGAFVAILGLTSTASGQIGKQFDELTATTVTIGVTDATARAPAGEGEASAAFDAFPKDADARLGRLNGVIDAGVWRRLHFARDPVIGSSPAARSGSVGDIGSTTPVFASSAGTMRTIRPVLTSGVVFNGFHEKRAERVALLGAPVAAQLGISQLDGRPAIFIDQNAFTVVGIIGGTDQLAEFRGGIIIPRATADELYGLPTSKSQGQMIVRTRLGAARLIARQAPTALRPESPRSFAAVPPPEPRRLRDNIAKDLTGLFLLLAAISLVIGAVGIANTTFVAVLERTSEIGLRRSLGARPRHIITQFLTESMAMGLLGGLVGTSIGVVTVLGVAVGRHWTAILDPAVVLPAPLIGALTGLFAGLYPALRAARIEPQAALRQ